MRRAPWRPRNGQCEKCGRGPAISSSRLGVVSATPYRLSVLRRVGAVCRELGTDPRSRLSGRGAVPGRRAEHHLVGGGEYCGPSSICSGPMVSGGAKRMTLSWVSLVRTPRSASRRAKRPGRGPLGSDLDAGEKTAAAHVADEGAVHGLEPRQEPFTERVGGVDSAALKALGSGAGCPCVRLRPVQHFRCTTELLRGVWHCKT